MSMTGKITINRYGAVCLNADEVFFGDIDTSIDPRAPHKPVQDLSTLGALLARVVEDWGVCFRVYRTAAGVRLLELSRVWNPRSEDTQALLHDLRCDKAYIALTGRQNCFRARLTPKPWRSEVPEIDTMEAAEAYAAERSYRVAALVGVVGKQPTTVPDAVVEVVDLHDRLCNVALDLPLT